MPFDFDTYTEKCSTMEEAELDHEWQKCTCLITAAATSTAISGGSFAMTLGASGMSLIFSAGAIHNARVKRGIIEESMVMRFNHKPRTRKRDVLRGFALSVTVNGITMGVGDLGTSQLLSEAMQHGWVEVINHPDTVAVGAEGAQLAIGSKMEDNRVKNWGKKDLQKI